MKSEEIPEEKNYENKYEKVPNDEIDDENNTKLMKIEEENLLEQYLDTLTFNFQVVKLIILLTVYLTAEGFVMIGISLMVPVIAEPWNLSPLEKGLLGGSVLLGFTIGSAYAGNVSDTKGRRIAFCWGNIISLIGGLIGVFLAQDVWWLFTSNFLVGFGIGFSVNSVFSLTSELTNKFWRSIIIGGIWYSFVLGELAGCYIAIKYEMYLYSNSNWRLLLTLRTIGFLFSALLIFTVCESPEFLMTTGQTEKAFQTLKFLFGEERYESIFTLNIREKIRKQYRVFMLKSHAVSGNRWDLFKSNYLVISLILFLLWWTCSFVYYGFMYILPAVYQKLHLHTMNKETVDQTLYDDIIADVILSCLFEIPATVLDALLPVLIGRKNSILVGFLVTAFSTFMCCISTEAIPIYSAISKATITISFHTLYTFASEVYPTYMRTTAIGMCNFFSRIGGFSTSFINEYLIGLHIIAPFIGFTATCFICFLLTLFLNEPNKNKVY